MLALSHRTFRPNLPVLFQRIGLGYNPTTTKPTLELLNQLHLKWLQTFPFENLDLHLSNQEVTDKNQCKVDINPEIIEKKLLFNQRGGYCFEQNQYFNYVLRELGYHVTPIMARVVWKMPPETAQNNRNHLANVVTFPPSSKDRRVHQYLCDVASGPACFVEPIALHESMIGKPQATKYDTHRIVRYEFTQGEEAFILDNSKDHYLLQVLKDSGEWDNFYIFHLKELSTFADWYCSNWHVATFPSSFFLNCILLSIVTEEGKYTLFNNELIIRKINSIEGTQEEGNKKIEDESKEAEHVIRKEVDRNEYFELLSEVFKFKVDEELKGNLKVPGIDYPAPKEEDL